MNHVQDSQVFLQVSTKHLFFGVNYSGFVSNLIYTAMIYAVLLIFGFPSLATYIGILVFTVLHILKFLKNKKDLDYFDKKDAIKKFRNKYPLENYNNKEERLWRP